MTRRAPSSLSPTGVPYFAPIPDSVTNPQPSAEQHRELWAAVDLMTAARALGGFVVEHSSEDYAAASKLYDAAAKGFEQMTPPRSCEAECARHMAQRCREKAGGWR